MPKYDKQERKELVDKARKMYESGKSVSEITEEIGISWVTMYRWMKEEGVQMRPPAKRNRKKYDLEMLRKLAEQGLNMQEIGEKMGASHTTVGRWLDENNIQINENARRMREKEKRAEETRKQGKAKKKCATCRYRADAVAINGCDYVDLMEHSRGCPIIGCTKYEKGPRIRRKKKKMKLIAG